VTPAWRLEDGIDPFLGLRRRIVATASNEQELVAVPNPDARPNRLLDPDERTLVLEAPGLDHIERLAKKGAHRSEE
jgi:hypothetical protein